MLNLKTNRLDELLGTITEARKSLQDWQDKRTEALIQLDALSYDIRQIEEEKNRSAELIAALKNEIEDRAKVYASHVESITDQMQLLKVEKEEMAISLNEAIDRLQKQLDESELQRNRQRESEAEIVSTWELRLAEQRSDFEVRYAEQHNRHRDQVESLNLEINSLLEKIEVLKAQVAEAEIRGDRNDRELQVFRSQMMNLLKISEGENLSDFFKPAAAVPAAQPLPAAAAEARTRFNDRPANPNIIPTAEALNLAAQGRNQNGEVAAGAVSAAVKRAKSAAGASAAKIDQTNEGGVIAEMGADSTVEEYLKRLGY